jgi:hypothetical protein
MIVALKLDYTCRMQFGDTAECNSALQTTGYNYFRKNRLKQAAPPLRTALVAIAFRAEQRKNSP